MGQRSHRRLAARLATFAEVFRTGLSTDTVNRGAVEG